jgi:tetratricopeptide (TPR) repeat protein
MTLADYYDRVINWPDQGGLAIGLSAGLVILCLAAILLYFGKFRRFARGLGIVGCIVIMAVLWQVREQTVTQKQGRRVTVTTLRFSPQIRRATTAALIALPTAAAVVMAMVFSSTRRRLRAGVPGHLKAGQRHLVNKDYSAALRECNQAIETAPELGEGYYRRGAVLQAMGDLSHALEDFDRALEHDPQLASAYLQRGKIHTEQGSLDLALADFEQFMALRANDPESYLHRGICLFKKGFLGDAAADFQRVLKLTNHTDFAEPAKEFLRECQDHPPGSLPAPGGNGSMGERSLPWTKSEEHNP